MTFCACLFTALAEAEPLVIGLWLQLAAAADWHQGDDVTANRPTLALSGIV